MVNEQLSARTSLRIKTHLQRVVNERNLTIARHDIVHVANVIQSSGVSDLVSYAIVNGDLQTAADLVNATYEMCDSPQG